MIERTNNARVFLYLYDCSKEDPGPDSYKDAVIFAHWTRFAFDNCTSSHSFTTGLHQQSEQIKGNLILHIQIRLILQSQSNDQQTQAKVILSRTPDKLYEMHKCLGERLS